MSIWRFAQGFDSVPEQFRITLGEGDTPLIRSEKIGPQAGLANLYFKLELANPTGSFKDRFGAAAISHMLANKKRVCIATSSGNTGASLAACCAKAGIPCKIAVVETAPEGKLKQMRAYGAEILRVRKFGLDPDATQQAFDLLKQRATQPDTALQVSSFIYSPAGMSGVQTISYELAEQTTRPIDHVFCPAGGGGLTLAVCRGFRRLVEQGQLEKSPAVECVQPEGNNTMAGPLRDGMDRGQAITCTTKISGLQVPNINDASLVVTACRASGGTGHLVTDQNVWSTQKRLAREEGIFSEPAGATALAGVLQAAANGYFKPDAHIICLITGFGFKDEESIGRMVEDVPIREIDVEGLATC
ncbi:MAG: pyridoxal-phosphate dependent enzyme [Planctomycetota bacterium]|nr:pyridoxal-phosphate dependent enzyme [Planctomycetota bacterium]MDA1211733.1 pyridoxal-phosphate dependent enzyme [Planctomycetota bacterium]